jgi:hypothetical protein
LIADVSVNRLKYTIPVLLGLNVIHVLLLERSRPARVLIFGCYKEVLGEILLRMGGWPASAYVPGDGDGRERESEKAEDRDGKEDIHVTNQG